MGRCYPGYSHTKDGNDDRLIRKFTMEIDLHGHHPPEIVSSGVLDKIVRQAWEMGQSSLCFIHGHGRNRGISPGFVNTNTGYFGVQIRKEFRHGLKLRHRIHHTTLNCSHPGRTCVQLKKHLHPRASSLMRISRPIRWRNPAERLSSSIMGSYPILRPRGKLIRTEPGL
jgi:hypothetical protein